NAVTLKGARLLARWLDCEVEDLDWHQIDWRLSRDYIGHHLLNNDFRVAITKAVWETPKVALERWDDEFTLKSTHSADKIKLKGPKGRERTYPFVPDDYFILSAPRVDGTQRYFHFFVEADNNTEPGFSTDESRRSFTRKIQS